MDSSQPSQQPDAFDAALAEYNVQHGVTNAPPPTAPPPPRTPSGPARAAAAVGGLALVLLVTLGTAGLALAAFAGMGVAALVQRRRARPYTRVAGWLGGVGGAMTAFAALSIASVVPANFTTEIRRQMQAESRRPRRETAFDSVYGRVAPASKAAGDAQARAVTDAMSRSPGPLGALLGFAAVFGVGFYGALVGSAAWGSASVLQFGLTGRWPARSGGAARLLRPPPAPQVRDAFDAIR